MIVAGRVSQKMAPVLRQIYDQMPEPKWVISMGVCASSGGMFNNYAIVQGVDHDRPRRHLPARLPAAARDADRRDPQAPRQDPEHKLGVNARRGGPRGGGGGAQGAAHDRDEGAAAMSDANGTGTVQRLLERREPRVGPRRLQPPRRSAARAAIGDPRPIAPGHVRRQQRPGDTSGYGGLVRLVRLPGAGRPPLRRLVRRGRRRAGRRPGGAGPPPGRRDREGGRRPRTS